MGRLEGRTMVITGAGQGLGRTMTRRFVAEGARVIAAARNLERLEEAIAPLGDKAFAVAADLGDPEGVDKVFAEADKRFGKLEVLIYNAAI
jgi:NAD(P)-dependent dehydrogenase (short-subunit alcohol dehydrogenase family)